MVKIFTTTNLLEGLHVLPMLATLTMLYPDFENWYINKALPGIVMGSDKLFLAKDNGKLVGVALAKKSRKETKLRCVRVLPSYAGTGLGVRLIDTVIETLGNKKPHCTVAEEMMHTYSRLFVNRYGFSLDAVEKGLYRPSKLEYVFNAVN